MNTTDRITFANYVSRKIKLKDSQYAVDSEDYYCHPTYVITNLSDYISLISQISHANETLDHGDTVVFRGMSNKDYDLKPGLSRIERLYESTEQNLINGFLTRRPDAFKDLNEFDMLAKMQHYGLPTRLLDFTTNPLIALFFACEAPFSKNPGRVLCHYSFLQNDNSEYIKAICDNAVNMEFDNNYTFEDYFRDEDISLGKYMREFYMDNETTIIRPKYWNQRIANQAGVFMLFPNNLQDKYLGIIKHIEELGVEKAIKEYGRYDIDKTVLSSIMHTENIDYYRHTEERFISDNYYLNLIRAYKPKGNELLQNNIANRFIINQSLKELSKEKISNEFCSIIIESNNKKKIQRELSLVGIGVDYIYPELEYTAKEIKNLYV